jgi:hypothetical protein
VKIPHRILKTHKTQHRILNNTTHGWSQTNGWTVRTVRTVATTTGRTGTDARALIARQPRKRRAHAQRAAVADNACARPAASARAHMQPTRVTNNLGATHRASGAYGAQAQRELRWHVCTCSTSSGDRQRLHSTVCERHRRAGNADGTSASETPPSHDDSQRQRTNHIAHAHAHASSGD